MLGFEKQVWKEERMSFDIEGLAARFCYRYLLDRQKRDYFWRRFNDGDFGSSRYEIYNYLRIVGIHSRKTRRSLINALRRQGVISFGNVKIEKVVSASDLRKLRKKMRNERCTCVQDTAYNKAMILFDDCTYEADWKLASKLERLIYEELDNVWFII